MLPLSRREFLKVSAASLGVTALAACAPTGGAPAGGAAPAGEAASTEGVELLYWINWGADAADTIASLAELDSFKEQFPDSTLTVVPTKDMQALLAAIASGEAPDGASNLPYPELYAREALVPVTDWISVSEVIDSNDIFEANWEGAQYEGETWGVPAVECFVRYALCYNVDMFEEAGLDPENPPRTWSEVYAAHEALTTFDDAGNVQQIGLDPFDAMGGSIGNGNPWMIPASWGFQYYDVESRTYNIDNEEMVSAWETLKQFYDLVGPEQISGFRQSYGQWTGPTSAFASGVEAMLISGYWTPGSLSNSAPDKNFAYTWLPVPDDRADTRVQVAGGHYIVIPSVAKNPETMYKFAEYCNSDEACDIIYESLGWLPARKSYVENRDVSNYSGLDFFIESSLDNDEYGSIVTDPITGITAQTWYDLREEHYFGDITAEQAVAQMQETCTESLAEMLDR